MTPETPTPDLINLMEWNRFAEQGMTLLEALTILNNRHRAEIGAMREALQEAHTTLEGIAIAKPSEWGEMSDQFKPWAQNRARHALTKLKPFTTP